MRPQRIVLSRRAGFDLQAASRALNGRPAQSVARPGRWGNPFTIADIQVETGLDPQAAQAEAVRRYGRWLHGELAGPSPAPAHDAIVQSLGGKNLACWCPIGTPCHIDVLLAAANE